jgi:hypothetical protein
VELEPFCVGDRVQGDLMTLSEKKVLMMRHKWKWRKSKAICIKCGAGLEERKRKATRGVCGFARDLFYTSPDGDELKIDASTKMPKCSGA